MYSINFEPLTGPTQFKCSCGGDLYIENSTYQLNSIPNNFYCKKCFKRELSDDETLMWEYFMAKSRNKEFAKRRFENWIKNEQKKHKKNINF